MKQTKVLMGMPITIEIADQEFKSDCPKYPDVQTYSTSGVTSLTCLPRLTWWNSLVRRGVERL